MNESDIRNKITNKNGKLNGNYNVKLSNEEKQYVLNLYPLYSTLSDCCHAVVNSDYKRCESCNKIFEYGKKPYIKNCSKTCKSNSSREKRKQTNIERYGVDNPSKSEEIKQRIVKSNLERYGVEYVAQNDTVKEKMKKTNLDRYGVEYVTQNKNIQATIQQTNIERYGCTNVLNSDYVKNRKFDRKQKYILEITGKLLNYTELENLNINEQIHNYDKEYIISLVDGTLTVDQINDQYISSYSKYNKYRENGINVEPQNSIAEKTISEYISSLNIQYHDNDRTVIAPYELDIYIPEHKPAIEFNGSYWHSDKFKDKHYRQMKTKMCNEKGITLIHVYEYLFEDKRHIYESIIKSKLQLNERVYARKCVLKEVPKQEEKDFLNAYHLQGFVGSSKCYGLYYNDELLTLCSFGKSRFNKKYEYELLRNCSKPNITVVGGLSKIIKHYKSEIDNGDIICYSDASISYNKNSDLTQPNYVWVKHGRVLKRYNTMKHKLKKLLGDNFDENLSESENMISNEYYRIYDSGNYKTKY